MDKTKAQKIVCEAGIRLVKEGLVARTWGNISFRVDASSFVITPSGRTYEKLTPGEIVQVDIGTLKYGGSIKPSSEKGMHAEIFKMRPDVNAVIHTHQTNASTVASARREVTGLSNAHKKIIGESVRCAAYALPGTKKLKLAAAAALEGRNAALLANHGAVCVGESMEDAFRVAMDLEKACEEFIEREFMKEYRGAEKFSHGLMYAVYLEKFA